VVVPNPAGTIQVGVKPDTVVMFAGVAATATVAVQTDSPPISLGDLTLTGVNSGLTMSAAPSVETKANGLAFDTAKVSLLATSAVPAGVYAAHLPVSATCVRRTVQDFGNFAVQVINGSASVVVSSINTAAGVPLNLGQATGTVVVVANASPHGRTPTQFRVLLGNTVVATNTIANSAPVSGTLSSTLSFNSTAVANGTYQLTVQLLTREDGSVPATSGSVQVTVANP